MSQALETTGSTVDNFTQPVGWYARCEMGSRRFFFFLPPPPEWRPVWKGTIATTTYEFSRR